MAVTKIWNIKGWLGAVEVYIENPAKTENPAFFVHSKMSDEATQNMRDLIELAMTDERADELRSVLDYAMDEEKTNQQFYVSGVNCSKDTARSEMLAVKARFGKEDGNVAYHAIQSFKPGEVSGDLAHRIGVALASEMWSDFQVVVATHIDHSHIHNHFLLNSVSFVDGRKYNDCKESYRRLRKISDRLCLENGLSVVHDPQPGRSTHYSEWSAEKQQQPTYRGTVRADIDSAIRKAQTERQFYAILRSKGYDFKFGKDITIVAKGRERGLKLERNFGEEYTIERIRKRIIEFRVLPKRTSSPQLFVVRYQLCGSFQKCRKLKGFQALYISYMFKMGILPKKRRDNPNKAPPHILFREDLLKIRQYDEEIRLLLVNRIDSPERLLSFVSGCKNDISEVEAQRKKISNHLRYVNTDEERLFLKSQISDLSKQIAVLRKEVKISVRIQDKIPLMREKLREVSFSEISLLQQNQKSKGAKAR